MRRITINSPIPMLFCARFLASGLAARLYRLQHGCVRFKIVCLLCGGEWLRLRCAKDRFRPGTSHVVLFAALPQFLALWLAAAAGASRSLLGSHNKKTSDTSRSLVTAWSQEGLGSIGYNGYSHHVYLLPQAADDNPLQYCRLQSAPPMKEWMRVVIHPYMTRYSSSISCPVLHSQLTRGQSIPPCLSAEDSLALRLLSGSLWLFDTTCLNRLRAIIPQDFLQPLHHPPLNREQLEPPPLKTKPNLNSKPVPPKEATLFGP